MDGLTTRDDRRLHVTVLVTPFAVAAVAALTGVWEPRSLLIAGAVLVGWSQLVGL